MTHGTKQTMRRAAAFAAVLIVAVAASGCNKLKARDLLNKGVASFKNGQSDTAIEDFKQAKEADPELLNARLYLATAYASTYIPGAPSAENMAHGNQAVAEFKEVLDKDQNNLSAIDGIGSILFQMAGQPFDQKKFEESKTYHQRHIQLKPEDPEPYYWIGVIDWTIAFRGNGELRVAYNKDNIKKQVKDTDPLPAAVRTEYSSKYGAIVDEGIEDSEKGHLRPAGLRRCDGVSELALSSQGRHGGVRRRARQSVEAGRRSGGQGQRDQAAARGSAATDLVISRFAVAT